MKASFPIRRDCLALTRIRSQNENHSFLAWLFVNALVAVWVLAASVLPQTLLWLMESFQGHFPG